MNQFRSELPRRAGFVPDLAGVMRERERAIEQYRLERVAALAAFSCELEELFLHAHGEAPSEEDANGIFQKIESVVGDRMQAEQYVRWMQEKQQKLLTLEQQYCDENDHERDEVRDPDVAEDIGSAVFYDVTGVDSIGRVHYARDLLSIVLYIEHPRDLERLKAKFYYTREDKIGGFFSKHAYAYSETAPTTSLIPLIAIAGKRGSARSVSLVHHERQHSLNHLVFGVKNQEAGEALNLRPIDHFHDEVVALVRSGDGNRIAALHAKESLYDRHNIQPLIEQDADVESRVRGGLMQLQEQLRKFHALADVVDGTTSHELAALAYMLIRAQNGTITQTIQDMIRMVEGVNDYFAQQRRFPWHFQEVTKNTLSSFHNKSVGIAAK